MLEVKQDETIVGNTPSTAVLYVWFENYSVIDYGNAGSPDRMISKGAKSGRQVRPCDTMSSQASRGKKGPDPKSHLEHHLK